MSYEAAKAKIDLFNEAAGNYSNVDNIKLEAQLKVVVEEVKELINATNDLEKLDGICDALVTLRGLQCMLMIVANDMEFKGFDVAGALETISDNNLTKFIVKDDTITNTTEAKLKFGEEVVSVSECVMPDDSIVFVGKDANGKIRKPLDYVSVDIEGFLPK